MSSTEKKKPRWPALAGLVVLVGAYFGLDLSGVLGEKSGAAGSAGTATQERPAEEAPAAGGGAAAPRPGTAKKGAEDDAIAKIRQAFAQGTSDLWITLDATVERTLKDDDEGSRHQRFILRLADDLTVLVAHNIDLAPRVPLAAGDSIRLHGEYEWNHQGGVIHWTHAYSDGRPRGWIEHEGERYQ